MFFKTIFPLNIFVYFFKRRTISAKQYPITQPPIFRRQVLVWKINAESKRLECHFLSSTQPEEEAPFSLLLAS